MRFIISRNVLEESLNIVSKAVTNKTPIAVLTGIKFDLDERGLTLTGSDTDLSISTFIPVENNTKQNITVFSILLTGFNNIFLHISKKKRTFAPKLNLTYYGLLATIFGTSIIVNY